MFLMGFKYNYGVVRKLIQAPREPLDTCSTHLIYKPFNSAHNTMLYLIKCYVGYWVNNFDLSPQLILGSLLQKSDLVFLKIKQ